MPLPTARPSQRTSTASPASKSPSTSTTPDRQQARAALAQGVLGALVHEQPPAAWASRTCSQSLKLDTRPSCGWKSVPLGAPARAAATASRSTPLVIVTGMPAAVAISAATTFERIPPDPSGERRHADVVVLELLDRPHLLDALRARVGARVGAVEPAGVGEQYQPVRADQDRHLRREEVVVAERDLVGGGGVVLVDHRHAPASAAASAACGARSGSASAPTCRRT